MRSTLSDPISAGVDTFSKLTRTFDEMENSSQRRELMAQTEADRRLKAERDKKTDDFEEEKRGQFRKAWGDQAQKEHDEPILYDATEAEQIRAAKGKDFDPAKDWNDKHINAMLYFYNHTNMSDDKLSDVKYLKTAFEKMGQSVEGKDGAVNLSNDARAQKAFNNVFGTGKQKDKYGNSTESMPVTAVVKGTDQTMPTAFEMEHKYPAGKTYNHIPYGKGEFVNMAPENPTPAGLTEPGNIDLNKRPVVKNKDGSISTVLSSSFNIDGKEVLLPLVSDDGKILTDDEAIAQYKKTGQHLGIFDNSKDADVYAEQLHSSKIWKADLDYYGKESQRDMLRMGEGGDPDAPVHGLPAQLLYGKLDALDNMASAVHHYRAKIGGTKFLEKMEATAKTSQQNKTVKEATGKFQKWLAANPDSTTTEQRIAITGMFPDETDPAIIDKIRKEIVPDKQPTEKNPTPASLAMDEAKGDPKAKKARQLMNQDETDKIDAKEKAKKKYKTDKEGKDKDAFKAGQIKRVEDIGDKHGDLVKKIAKDDIRKNGGDADKAVDDAVSKVKKLTAGIKSGKEAVKKLVAAGYDEDDAIAYVKRNSEKKAK